ncbi:MAG: hypothetical protein M1831_006502 [Alyxoria varia]|nr:MAG: hypothetical protein M1831_006502 [Alyxoria varia]
MGTGWAHDELEKSDDGDGDVEYRHQKHVNEEDGGEIDSSMMEDHPAGKREDEINIRFLQIDHRDIHEDEEDERDDERDWEDDESNESDQEADEEYFTMAGLHRPAV